MSVSTVMVRVLVDAVERAGVGREELLRPLGVDLARLDEADGRFDQEEFARLQVRALDLTGDEALGLHLIELTLPSAFDLISHLVSHAPTLREAFALCVQFRPILFDDAHVTLTETGTSASMRCALPRTLERADRMQAELVVTGFFALLRSFAGASAKVQIAAFEHPRPAHHAQYSRVFGDAARFNQSWTGITFDRAVLERPQLHQHPELFAMLRSQAERALDRVAKGVGPVDQVKRYLLARPPARIPDISTAARDLGLSARSLRRRLAEDATSYRTLVRSILESSAGQMLRDPKRSIQETACALGFSNVGAFHRAFKRWTGMTPAQYREQRRSPAGDEK